ncbi:MAG TPA: ComEC/Rec2 family competence protein, partial [Propionibacteriaceae bacterium]|nr:ComEC/Rec2 family competence protein [Propionibacteriaceae bacterium]
MNAWLRRRVEAARTGIDGLVVQHWRNRELGDTGAAASRQADLRMVPIAAAGWGAAWVGTEGSPAGIAATAVGVSVAVVLAGLRRSAMVLAVALVATVIVSAGVIDLYRLRHGPVALLAGQRAVVSAELEIRTDPHLVAGGATAGAAVLKASTVRMAGRGQDWLVRAPMLVVVTGQQFGQWFQTPVGTRVAVDGRLEAADPGSDVAAVLRVRGSPMVVEQPSAGLRLVERVRAGLRRAVADRRPEPRGLVPALVLGDTSGLAEDLTRDFQTTGLTHLTAVSGANLTLLLAFLLTVARWVGVRGWWLRGV